MIHCIRPERLHSLGDFIVSSLPLSLCCPVRAPYPAPFLFFFSSLDLLSSDGRSGPCPLHWPISGTGHVPYRIVSYCTVLSCVAPKGPQRDPLYEPCHVMGLQRSYFQIWAKADGAQFQHARLERQVISCAHNTEAQSSKKTAANRNWHLGGAVRPRAINGGIRR